MSHIQSYFSAAASKRHASTDLRGGGSECVAFSAPGFTLVLSADLPPPLAAKVAKIFNTWKAEGILWQQVNQAVTAYNNGVAPAHHLQAIQGLEIRNKHSRISYIPDVSIYLKADLDAIRGQDGQDASGLSMDIARPLVIFEMSSHGQTPLQQMRKLLAGTKKYDDVVMIHIATEKDMKFKVNTERLYYIPPNFGGNLNDLLNNRASYSSVKHPNHPNQDRGWEPPGMDPTRALLDSTGLLVPLRAPLGNLNLNINLLEIMRAKAGDPFWIPAVDVVPGSSHSSESSDGDASDEKDDVEDDDDDEDDNQDEDYEMSE